MEMRPLTYDWASFTLKGGADNYSVKENIRDLFKNVPLASRIQIFYSRDIRAKFNSVMMPEILFKKERSPFISPDGFPSISDVILKNISIRDINIEIWLW